MKDGHVKTERHEEAGIQGESQMMMKTRDWSDTSTSQGVTGNDCAGLGWGVLPRKNPFIQVSE